MNSAPGGTEAVTTPTSLDAFNTIDQAALDAIPTAFCVCATDASLVRYNRRAVEIWGRAPQIGDSSEQSAKTFHRYSADGSPLQFSATPVGNAMRTGEPVLGAELIIERPDSSRVPVLMNVVPLKDLSGRVIGAACAFQELTERKLAEQALRESEAELQSVINRTPFMLVRCGRDMRYRFISRAYAQWLGSPREEIVGKTIAEALGDKGFATLRPHIETVLTGREVDFECEITFQGAGARRLRIAYRPETDAAGKVNGWIASLLDVTEQNRAVTELRALSEKLEHEVERRTLERDRIWNVSEDLLAVSNFEGHFTSMNPAWTRLLGWTEDEIKSMHVSELRHPDDAEHTEAARRRQKMEAIGQLTGGVAHDFNNLLMIVSGHAQRLKKRVSEPKDARSVEAIQMAAQRGENLTRQLLSFSRTLPLDPPVISVADAARAMRDVLAGSLHVNVAFSVDIPGNTWPVSVDKSELDLSLVNLVVNARDAMPEGGRISITAGNVTLDPSDPIDGKSGDFVALNVVDTGGGIPPELLSRVVEPFFTTKGPDKGTGLSLSQVYGFAYRSGGTMKIHSEVGRGTTVTIYLPRSHAAVDAPSPDNATPHRAADNCTILVVEDNPDVKNVAVSLLEELGYRTVAVETADEALGILAAGQKINLVFTDVALPGELDGLALARRVTHSYGNIPIVLTTGYTKVFDSDLEFPVLRKPYQIAALGRLIHQALYPLKVHAPQ